MAVIVRVDRRALIARGLVGLALGTLALAWPHILLRAFVLCVGEYALADGALALFALPLRSSRVHGRGALLLEALVGFTFGIATLLWLLAIGHVWIALIALWALTTGVFEIVASIALRPWPSASLLLGLGGLTSIALAALLLLRPNASAAALARFIGFHAAIFGTTLVVLGVASRSTWPPSHTLDAVRS